MAAYWEPEGYHQLGKGEFAGIATKDVLSRMGEATRIANQEKLAEWLGMRQAELSDAKRRNTLPIRWLHLLLQKHINYNPLWVLTGQGNKQW